MLTAKRLREIFEYDSETGVFKHTGTRRGTRAGEVAGSRNKHGYTVIGIDYVTHTAHRLAWLYVYGEWPAGIIDHINRDRADNRISNLRVADASENAHNTGNRVDSRSGAKGVSWHKGAGKWRAYYTNRGRTYHLGLFDDFNDAVKSRQDATSWLQSCG